VTPEAGRRIAIAVLVGVTLLIATGILLDALAAA